MFSPSRVCFSRETEIRERTRKRCKLNQDEELDADLSGLFDLSELLISVSELLDESELSIMG